MYVFSFNVKIYDLSLFSFTKKVSIINIISYFLINSSLIRRLSTCWRRVFCRFVVTLFTIPGLYSLPDRTRVTNWLSYHINTVQRSRSYFRQNLRILLNTHTLIVWPEFNYTITFTGRTFNLNNMNLSYSLIIDFEYYVPIS